MSAHGRARRAGFLKGEVVVGGTGAGHGGQDGAVAVEREVQVADGVEEAVGGAERGCWAPWCRLFWWGEEIRMLGDEQLDHEEQRRLEQRQELGDGQ